MKNSKTEKKPKTESDPQTKELLERSEMIINRSLMLVEYCDIESKRIAELFEESDRLMNWQRSDRE